jgi:hypothetical protein
MAISKIGSKALVDCSVAAVDIADNSITAAKLAGSIANAKLANSSVTINSTSISLGGSANINALDWQSVIVADGSTGTTGVAGRGYFINTTSAAHTFTLPVSATRGDTIAIKDYAGTFATFNLTIARNGHNIQGVANNSLISTNRASVVLVYVDVTRGWEFTTESNVADLQEQLFITATGGTITTSGDFKIHTFTNDGCFAVSQVGNPIGGGSNVDYLVVAGGGGGSSVNSGGGGAGGFREGKSSPAPSYTASPLVAPAGITVTATTYPVTVGAGGSGGIFPNGSGTKGSDSVFSTITSTGGGYGIGDTITTPSPGGSGGGGGGNSGNGIPTGQSGNTPPVSPPQGNPGGNVGNPGGGDVYAGGGGGAGGAGPNGGGSNCNPKGADGVGTQINPAVGTPGPSAPLKYFSGGGTGAWIRNAPPRSAGSPSLPGPNSGGGGSAGAGDDGLNGGNGTANSGGGGGGSRCATGGSGGKGIIVIRYQFQ